MIACGVNIEELAVDAQEPLVLEIDKDKDGLLLTWSRVDLPSALLVSASFGRFFSLQGGACVHQGTSQLQCCKIGHVWMVKQPWIAMGRMGSQEVSL
jgi:hypothetical protein